VWWVRSELGGVIVASSVGPTDSHPVGRSYSDGARKETWKELKKDGRTPVGRYRRTRLSETGHPYLRPPRSSWGPSSFGGVMGWSRPMTPKPRRTIRKAGWGSRWEVSMAG